MRPSNQNASTHPRLGRVIVTGGAGFVGAALCRQLLRDGWQVDVLDDLSGGRRSRLPVHSALEFHLGDAGDAATLLELLNNGPPVTAFVHLAAVVGVRRVLADPEGCRAEHERLTSAVVVALSDVAANRRPRLYAASTSEVYAESNRPLAESCALRDKAGRGRWAYAGSKRAAEDRFDALRTLWTDDSGCESSSGPVHLRFFNVVGPGQDADSGMVLPNFIERAREGRVLEVHGDGEQQRTFAHVDEVAACVAALIARGDVPAGPLNLGGQACSTIGALAALVNERAGAQSQIVRVDPLRACGTDFEDVRCRIPELSLLEQLGLPVPSRGLESIIDDCLANHPRTAVLAASAGRNACASPAS